MPLDGNAIPGSISERTKIGPIVVEWKRFQSCFQSNRNEMLPAVGKDKFYGMIVPIYQTGKNVLSMRSKASTRLHGIRFIYCRTFSKEESINDGLRRYIYNIRAPRYLLLPLFEYFLWYSISFTTRGPFNYSRCGITPTVIFVHANASRCISFSPSSFYPPPLSPGHISG